MAAAVQVGGYGSLFGAYMASKPNTTLLYEALMWANDTGTNSSSSLIAPNVLLVMQSSTSSANSSAGVSANTFANVKVNEEQREAALRYGQCGEPEPLAWHLMRPASDPEFPWPGTIFGVALTAIWYWCSDQVRCSY